MNDEAAEDKASKTYPVERGSQFFAPLPILDQKDADRETSRLYAERELQRIRENMDVLRKQAEAVFERMEIAEWVRSASYNFQPIIGKPYHIYDSACPVSPGMKLMHIGPSEWSSGVPGLLLFKASVRMLPDRTWEMI